jgi:hypothetical protein
MLRKISTSKKYRRRSHIAKARITAGIWHKGYSRPAKIRTVQKIMSGRGGIPNPKSIKLIMLNAMDAASQAEHYMRAHNTKVAEMMAREGLGILSALTHSDISKNYKDYSDVRHRLLRVTNKLWEADEMVSGRGLIPNANPKRHHKRNPYGYDVAHERAKRGLETDSGSEYHALRMRGWSDEDAQACVYAGQDRKYDLAKKIAEKYKHNPLGPTMRRVPRGIAKHVRRVARTRRPIVRGKNYFTPARGGVQVFRGKKASFVEV